VTMRRRWRLALVRLVLATGLVEASGGQAQEVSPPQSTDTRAVADPLEGHWVGKDPDGSMLTSSVIRIYRRDGRLYGKIVRTVDEKGREIHPVCERCPGDLKGARFTDIEFIRDLRHTGKAWTDGSVIDLRPGPLQGTVASCDLTLQDDGTAVLHGYLGLRWLGRASTWVRLVEPLLASPVR
jgi:uncharacterized protein (DUF2147 family)